ncbi:MAG TPA: LysR family transcriptional regulator [Candidatus Dormibacteraeota bacterium]|nr:LysR family transcriptional regulator [Candidatus Dormibacteraeota bacterium]
MSIGLRQLEAFRAVAITGSFTRACQSLFITQSTVSQHIHELETELKAKLFDRNRRHVSLTPAGGSLLQYCKQIFQLLNEAEGAVLSTHDPYSGRLSFGCASSTLLYQLPPLLTEYAKRFPKVELKIVGGTVADILTQMDADALDIALVVLPLHLTHVRKIHLRDESFVLVLPRKHRLARQRHVAIEQVKSDRFILHIHGQNTRKLVDRYLFRHHVAPHVPIEIADTETIKVMVAHRMGISVLPASAFEKGRQPEGLKTFPIPKAELKRSLAVIYPRSRPLRSPALAIVDLLQKHLRQILPGDGRKEPGNHAR